MTSVMKEQSNRKTDLRSFLKSAMAIVLALTLFVSAALATQVLAKEAETTTLSYFKENDLKRLKEKQDKLDAKIAENEKKLAEVQGSIDSQKGEVDLLNAQIDDYEEQIGVLQDRISLLNGDIDDINGNIGDLNGDISELDAKIAEAQQMIADTQKEIDDTTDLLLERMRASYISGNASELEMLFSSDDIATLLTRSELIKRVAENDQKLIKELENKVARLTATKKMLGEDKNEVEAKKAELNAEKQTLVTRQDDVRSSIETVDSKQSAVQEKYDRANEILDELDENSKEYKDLIQQYTAEREAVDKEIDEMIGREGSSVGEDKYEHVSSGGMIWPVPYDNCYISANYPYYPSGGYHGGIDICVSGGSSGKKIVAAQGGKVTMAGWSSGGYGNHIMIDHGNGLFTLYGHCQSLAVYEGQMVSKGQVIGYIGETGNATGPHLHFEVRKNVGGDVKRQSPLDYVDRPSDCYNNY